MPIYILKTFRRQYVTLGWRLQTQEISAVATFVRQSASDAITFLVSQLEAAGYVCEGTEGHLPNCHWQFATDAWQHRAQAEETARHRPDNRSNLIGILLHL